MIPVRTAAADAAEAGRIEARTRLRLVVRRLDDQVLVERLYGDVDVLVLYCHVHTIALETTGADDPVEELARPRLCR